MARSNNFSQSAVTVTTSATLLLAANGDRDVYTLQCAGSDLYVGYDNTVSTTDFVAMIPAGQLAEDEFWNGTVYGIVASGSHSTMATQVSP